jgi:hypothetical protein
VQGGAPGSGGSREVADCEGTRPHGGGGRETKGWGHGGKETWGGKRVNSSASPRPIKLALGARGQNGKRAVASSGRPGGRRGLARLPQL